MSDEKIIVLVSDRDDSRHGEISVLDDPQAAEHLVETLLEAGFDQDRIRVFTGSPSEFEISHRPVVALVADGEEAEPEAVPRIFRRDDDPREVQARPAPAEELAAEARRAEELAAKEPPAEEPRVEEPPPAEALDDQPRAEQAAAAVGGTEGEPEAQPPIDDAEEEKEPAEAAPVRFSSLFRSS